MEALVNFTNKIGEYNFTIFFLVTEIKIAQ